jgi:hypothetical protein
MTETKPRRSIRRFDVFAEYQRLEALKDRQPEDEAKGYGIWLAKLVAARRFGGAKSSAGGKSGGKGAGEKERDLVDGKWRTLDDVPQTDELFESEIVDRMGSDFYESVFSPAIQSAFQEGKKYEDIRDEIRKDWKPK